MTVIAALELEGVPVLIGDFLVTDKVNAPSLRIPARPEVVVAPLQHRISDLRRKCILVNDRFIVGFSGDVASGRRIISALMRRFSHQKRGPTLQKIDKVLHEFTFNLRGKSAFLVGWTVHDKRPVCFSFEAKLGETVVPVKRSIIGSGAKTFRKYLNDPASRSVMSSAIRSASNKATLTAIAAIGRVVSEEVLSGEHLSEGFGGGAEVAIWNGSQFEFIPKITFLFWNIELDANHNMTMSPSRLISIYENKGRHSVFASFIQTGNASRSSANDFQTDIAACYLFGFRPLHDDTDIGLTGRDQPDLAGSYYFIGFCITEGPGGLSTTAGVSLRLTDDNSFFGITQNDGVFRIRLDRREVETLVRCIFPNASFNRG